MSTEASNKVYRQKQNATKLTAVAKIAETTWNVVGAAVTGNVISAVVSGVRGAKSTYNTVRNSDNKNYAASRVILPAQVDQMTHVLQDALGEQSPIIDEIAQKFTTKDLERFDKKLHDKKLTTQYVQNEVNAKAPKQFEKIQYAIQDLPKEKQYEVALCVTDRGRAELYVAALHKAKEVRKAKEAFHKKEAGTHTASEIIKHLSQESPSHQAIQTPRNPFKKTAPKQNTR